MAVSDMPSRNGEPPTTGRRRLDRKQVAVWSAVSLVAAVAWGVLALARGERVSAVWLVAARDAGPLTRRVGYLRSRAGREPRSQPARWRSAHIAGLMGRAGSPLQRPMVHVLVRVVFSLVSLLLLTSGRGSGQLG
jgi:hypothetical protein